MNKKAQSQIITTVLIILLVLAAIVIVWQVVRTTVEGGADEVTGGTDCVTLSLELVDVNFNSVAPFNTTFKVKRNAGSGDLDNIVVIIDGEVQSTEIPADQLDELETTTEQDYSIVGATAAATKLEIAARLSTNSNEKLCGIADTAP